MDRLKDKVAVITGGSSGIGAASAKLFQQEGARVAVFGRREEELSKARDQVGGGVLTVAGDVSKL